MSKFRNSSRFQMERLEDRRMMAGDVTATLNTDGTLVILEAGNSVGSAQFVQVQQLANGKVRVAGFASTGDPRNTQILNLAGQNLGAPEFSGVKNIRMDLGDGADSALVHKQSSSFRLQNIDIKTSGPILSQNDKDDVLIMNMVATGRIDVRTGAGNDSIRVFNSEVVRTGAAIVNFTIDSGVISSTNDSDRDEVLINGLKVDGFTSINTGASADAVTIKRATLGFPQTIVAPSHTTMIFTGGGADVIKLGSDGNDLNFVATRGDLIINTGHDSDNDVDAVQMRNVEVDQSLFVDLGGGADRLDMIQSLARKNITLSAMKGNDTAVLNDVHAFDNLFANMGEGDDTLDMTFVRAKRVEANAGLGFDRLRFSQMPVSPVQSGWENVNGRLTVLGRFGNLENVPIVPLKLA